MLNIDDFLLEYRRKTPKILITWLIILIFIISSLLIINNRVKITNYYKIEGVSLNNNLQIYVPIKDIKTIVASKTIDIDNYKYSYHVMSIDSNNLNYDGIYYREVIIKILLNDKIFIDNEIIPLKFIVNEMTIFEYIINLI